MNVAFAMLAASGVSTARVWPYPTAAGVAPVMLGRAPWNRYGGEYSSYLNSRGALAPSPLPVWSTRPSGKRSEVEWYSRLTWLLARVAQVPVLGLQSSAAWTAPAKLLKPGALVPPVTSTSPVGRIVAFMCRRAYAIEPVYLHAGLASFRSMTSAVFVGGSSPPPAYRIFPGSYMTADP